MINILQKIQFKKYVEKEKFLSLKRKYKYVEFDFFDMNPILFLSNQCLHTNRAFINKEGNSRITLLTHFFDPSPNYGIGNILRKLRNR